MSEKIYLPGLNGIRAVAAMSVVIAHINNRLDYYGLPKGKLLDLASYGVTIFFTLSGFLITFLLLKELQTTNNINIKKFYIRRVLRIWPLYYLYIILVVLFGGWENVTYTMLFYLLIIPNFKNSFVGIFPTTFATKTMNFMLGHYWSLGVEEQFYAFWPWIIKKYKNLLFILLFIPVFFVLLKLILRIFDAPYSILVFVNYTRFGCLSIGALAAYIYTKYPNLIAFFTSRMIEVLAYVFFIIVAINKFHITSIIDHEIVSFFTVIIIYNQIANTRKLINLELPYLDYLGRISYGLYVYNPLVIYLMSFLLSNFKFQNNSLYLLFIYSVVIFTIIIVAHISYFYFELKFLKIKSKFVTVNSVSSQKEFQS